MSCTAPATIHILDGFYGRLDGSHNSTQAPASCTHSSTVTDCDLNSALETVIAACEGELSCSFSTSHSSFGSDPCGGVVKYSYIKYQCLTIDLATNTQETTVETTEAAETTATITAGYVMKLRADNSFSLFADGEFIIDGSNYAQVFEIEIPENTSVVAILAQDTGGGYGLSVNSPKLWTSTSFFGWKCTPYNESVTDWADTDYNDEAWPAPAIVRHDYMIDADYIWTADGVSQIWCRAYPHREISIITGDTLGTDHFAYTPTNVPLLSSTSASVVFSVQAAADVHVALSASENDLTTNAYEIVIGGWSNSGCAMRRSIQGTDEVSTDCNYLNEISFVYFWIKWSQVGESDLRIAVGHGKILEQELIMEYVDSAPHTINYISVGTGWGSDGNWTFLVPQDQAATTVDETTTSIPETTTTPFVSSFPERKPPTETFQRENDLLQVLADLSPEVKKELGYDYPDFIRDCRIFGQPCYHYHFEHFFDASFGNCYIFNSGWNTSQDLYLVSRVNMNKGLELTLNLGQWEYVEDVGKTAGARVVVHDQKRMPFPEDEGIYVPPGYFSSVRVTQSATERLGKPYDEECVKEDDGNINRNMYEELYPTTRYTMKACLKTCYQGEVIQRCDCADPSYPSYAAAFDYKTVAACDARDQVQNDCMYGVNKDFIANKFECDCPIACSEMKHFYRATATRWPATNAIGKFRRQFANDFDIFANVSSDPKYYEDNLVKMEVYVASLDYKLLKQYAKYPLVRYLPDVAGIFGLWLGFTMLTIFELFELILDVAYVSVLKIKYRKEIKAAKTNAQKTSSSQAPDAPLPSKQEIKSTSLSQENTQKTASSQALVSPMWSNRGIKSTSTSQMPSNTRPGTLTLPLSENVFFKNSPEGNKKKVVIQRELIENQMKLGTLMNRVETKNKGGHTKENPSGRAVLDIQEI